MRKDTRRLLSDTRLSITVEHPTLLENVISTFAVERQKSPWRLNNCDPAHPLGKGEVESSILSGSTTKAPDIIEALRRRLLTASRRRMQNDAGICGDWLRAF
jgi:hypothetical protein